MIGFEYLWPWRYRVLIWQFARKDFVLRYRGTWLGIGWSLLAPLVMLTIYTLVFQHVFKSRWPSARSDGSVDFALHLFAGLLVFNWAAELLNRAPRLILEQPNLVTKVVFPLPVLAWSALLSASFHLVPGLLIWWLGCWWSGYWPVWSWLAMPLALLALVPWLLALVWLLSSVGVYLRDVSMVVGLGVSGLIFLTPIFYPVQALPEWLQPVAFMNPLTAPVEALRALMFSGANVPWAALMVTACSGLATAGVALWFTQRLRTGYADML